MNRSFFERERANHEQITHSALFKEQRERFTHKNGGLVSTQFTVESQTIS